MALIYDIFAERLYGVVGCQQFSMYAVSGGGRGRRNGLVDVSFKSRLSTTEEGINQRGGPLPSGEYECEYLANHPPFHECIHLRLLTSVDRLTLTKVGGHRALNSFYIHSRGPKGSDGCIVPFNDVDRHRLNRAIKDNPGTHLTVFNARYGLPATRDDVRLS
jgi:hypothetical protein